MFCTNCGTRIAEGTVHCTGCGSRMDGMSAVTNAAKAAFAVMDEDYKSTLLLGGGSVLSGILGILLASNSALFLMLAIPISITLGSMALNKGRNMENGAGYHLGMMGIISAAAMLYSLLIMYALKSAAASMAGAAMGGILGKM